MIFSNNRFGVKHSSFLEESNIFYANFQSVKNKNSRSPSDASAIESSKMIGILKLLGEHNERKRLMFGKIKNKVKIGYDVINNRTVCVDSKRISYGESDMFGYIDTTGTATGNMSQQVVIKGITELIEKNEMLIFWYTDAGQDISKDIFVVNEVKKRSFQSSEVKIYQQKSITNMSTIIAIAFDDGKFIASGISCDMSSVKALNNALDELKLLEWVNYKSNYAIGNVCNEFYISEFYKLLEKKELGKFNNEIVTNIQFKEFIKNIYVFVLDYKYIHAKTIKCCSTSLLNCLPKKIHLKNRNIDILRMIGEKNIEDRIDCVLL